MWTNVGAYHISLKWIFINLLNDKSHRKTAVWLGLVYFTNLKPFALMEHYTWFSEDTGTSVIALVGSLVVNYCTRTRFTSLYVYLLLMAASVSFWWIWGYFTYKTLSEQYCKQIITLLLVLALHCWTVSTCGSAPVNVFSPLWEKIMLLVSQKAQIAFCVKSALCLLVTFQPCWQKFVKIETTLNIKEEGEHL